jgi:NAD(P)H-hydrate epimerase
MTAVPIPEFYTANGLRVPAVTSDQMREIDRIAMEKTGPNLYQMMENAGRNLAALAMELLADNWNKAKIIILAGSGGNGGGGICAARHLANRNADVTLCLANPLKPGSVPEFQYKIFQHTPGKTIQPEELNDKPFDLILDALIGYSLKGAPSGSIFDLIRWANQTKVPILSLDVPSGVDSTTGETPGAFIRALWTMTLALPKTGLLPENTGNLYLADIGIPVWVYKQMDVCYTSSFNNKDYIPLLAEF